MVEVLQSLLMEAQLFRLLLHDYNSFQRTGPVRSVASVHMREKPEREFLTILVGAKFLQWDFPF
jgi:hypothetical protein